VVDEMFFQMIRDRRSDQRLAEADASSLIISRRTQAYAEARRRERASLVTVREPGIPAPEHWRRVALIIAQQGG
jgi:hypothetical protein